MKWLCVVACLFLFELTARNPFFLKKEHVQNKVKQNQMRYVLKGTIVGETPTACVKYQEKDSLVCVGDKIGTNTVIEIHCGVVRLKSADGHIETLQLADEKKAGG